MKGKHHTEETKRKISKKLLGRKLPEITRKRMSESRKGIPHSKKWCKNMSKALKGKTYKMIGGFIN